MSAVLKIFKSFGFVALLLGLAIVGKKIYMQPSYSSGESAPAFNGTLQNGKAFDIADLKGKFVLIDFWGSWCGPCRHENPTLVQFHHKYHPAQFKDADGFEVVSVGIETRKKSWERAIQKDGLNWDYHVFDKAESLRFFDSPIAKIYGVKEVPTKFLLNPKGEIIAVNLSFPEMDKLLTKSLKQ